jgi:hypothetical protein
MRLIFIYGAVASGKLTLARELGRLAALPVFHNHLIVDAVSAVFPFGTPAFIALRESFWLAVMREAACEGRSIIFTFAPEPTVTEGFPETARRTVQEAGGETVFVRLTVALDVQENRLDEENRREFGKMRSVEQLRELRPAFDICENRMPSAALTIDTTDATPLDAAILIANTLHLSPERPS